MTVWAGCLCFWVLGPGLEVPTAERAVSGRAVGLLGLEGLCEGGGGLCAWGAQITSGCFSLVTPWVTIAAGMLRKSVSTQLTLRSGQDRGQEAACLLSQRIRVNKCFWKTHYVPGTVLGIRDTEKNVKEQGSLPRWNLHLNVKKQMANHKQTNKKTHIRWFVRRWYRTKRTQSRVRGPVCWGLGRAGFKN